MNAPRGHPRLPRAIAPALLARLGFAALVAVGGASAQTYPSKPVRLISPYPPGGANDILARILGQKLGETMGQTFLIENRAGAAGNLGAELVAKASPDGYTLLMGQASNLTINVSLMTRMPFDPVRDFAPVTLVATTPNMLVVHPSLPVRTVRDLVVLAKSKPGALNYASSGSGTAGHLAGELFKRVAGVDMVHIPYKGAAPALTDVVAGHAHLYFTSPISAQPFVKGGRLRRVAVTSLKRSSSMPDIPTVAEAGFADFDVVSWWGILTPAGASKELIARLHAEIIKALALPEIRAKFAEQGADPASSTPEQFAAYIQSEIAKWGRLIKELGVKPE
ncbi:MAG: tripartite tricarboxylate transporter substrate binding protein [Proteobacteria bacterium]|nr:tripartite tricarboxylate transporter substrate binding protein [Burkholderiales bacterium]